MTYQGMVMTMKSPVFGACLCAQASTSVESGSPSHHFTKACTSLAPGLLEMVVPSAKHVLGEQRWLVVWS